jgi:hypothetical protein
MSSPTELPLDSYSDLSDEARSSLEDLLESLDHAIHYLVGIRDEIVAGAFAQDDALLTVEDMICSEGLDFVSALEDYGHSE